MKKKTLWWVLAALGATLCVSLLFTGKDTEEPEVTAEPEVEKTQIIIEQEEPDEVGTWEEYQTLSPEEREAYYQQFGSMEAFEEWVASVRPETVLPDFVWDKAGRQPDAYTWEEYLALSPEDQEAFYQWFSNEAAFEAWMDSAKSAETTSPDFVWDKAGKQPDAYTWEEYKALSPEDLEAFFRWFETEAAFEGWVKKVQPQATAAPVAYWNKPGKTPVEYTWEEYQALSAADQDAFFQWFGSVANFETWMRSVKPVETAAHVSGWDKPGKSPSEYTWEEYEALSREDQEAFYLWFGTQYAFEIWKAGAKPQETESANRVWNKPGKKPDAYTWEEYQALTPEEQEAFFQWFGSIEAFEAWMNSVKPKESEFEAAVWNKPGKKPDAYAWEEYQALTPEEQEAFFQWFGSVEAFEVWMNKVAE